MWVNNFQTPEIQAVLSSFFCDGNDIAGGSNRGGGWGEEGELNIGVQNGIRRQLKARGPIWGPTGPFLCSQHSKLKITDIGQPFVACPVLQAPIQESHDQISNGAKVLLEAYTGSKKSCHRNQTRGFGAKPAVECDSVLNQ